jgi:hypothetical protein
MSSDIRRLHRGHRCPVLMQTITTALLDMPSRRYKMNGAIRTLVPERHGLRRSNNSGALPAWWSRGSTV